MTADFRASEVVGSMLNRFNANANEKFFAEAANAMLSPAPIRNETAGIRKIDDSDSMVAFQITCMTEYAWAER